MKTRTVAGRTWHFTLAIGRVVGPEGFYHPTPIAGGLAGDVYVANMGGGDPRQRAHKIDHLTTDGEYIRAIGQGDFTWPEGLAVDQDGTLYCSDAYSHNVLAYDSEGTRVASWGEFGSAEGQLQKPAGLAVDAEGRLLVVDGDNHRVQTFTPDGEFISAWGTAGSDDGQLNLPCGITIDPAGDVYVADWGNDRVQKFAPDGTFLRRFGSTFDDGGQLRRPTDVAVDSDGDVYVVDWGNNRVQIYDSEGDIITGLYGDARVLSETAQEQMDANPDYVRALDRVSDEDMLELGRFERPRGIAIDQEDRVVVTDCTRCRLQIYAKDKDFADPQFNL
ncbi:MAG: DNA-binding beta-propeller fold protein YncE [Chloroflexi bacterium]|nr:MAG: DNA-binding beta-propeller fold protein YncE [Chloroflexota bacterium]